MGSLGTRKGRRGRAKGTLRCAWRVPRTHEGSPGTRSGELRNEPEDSRGEPGTRKEKSGDAQRGAGDAQKGVLGLAWRILRTTGREPGDVGRGAQK